MEASKWKTVQRDQKYHQPFPTASKLTQQKCKLESRTMQLQSKWSSIIAWTLLACESHLLQMLGHKASPMHSPFQATKVESRYPMFRERKGKHDACQLAFNHHKKNINNLTLVSKYLIYHYSIEYKEKPRLMAFNIWLFLVLGSGMKECYTTLKLWDDNYFDRKS